MCVCVCVCVCVCGWDVVQRTVFIATTFVPKHFDFKLNLPLQKYIFRTKNFRPNQKNVLQNFVVVMSAVVMRVDCDCS